ncbi:MAG: response regulator [Planctomycetes bacterium]|nr:response regulator [Planctomycetota bacterium]
MSDQAKPKVLVVDDEPELRELLADALSGMHLQVQAAASGKEAQDMARRQRPDILVTDLRLGDCTGLEVIDRLRVELGDIPAVVITGAQDPQSFCEASRRKPVELMTKPLDLPRLKDTIQRELANLSKARKALGRACRLRRLARQVNKERKTAQRQLSSTCADLTEAYRDLSVQLEAQQVSVRYQQELLEAKTDDDVFRAMFKTFVHNSGPLSGVALVCDESAELQIAGRFGVPSPDTLAFCKALAGPHVESALRDPQISLSDAGEQAQAFDESIRRYLVGVTTLAIPLLPTEGEMIGLVVLYRKGEQPFLNEDLALAELLAPPTALAVRRND